MKLISIPTLTLLLFILIGTSCSMIDEPDMPDNNVDVNLFITDSIKDSVQIPAQAQSDSILNIFKIEVDSILNNDPFFINDSRFMSRAKVEPKIDFKIVAIKTVYGPTGKMHLTIPVTGGEIKYTALSSSKGIPAGPIHFFTSLGDGGEDDFLAHDDGDYIRIEGKVWINYRTLGIITNTETRRYVIYVNHPTAQVGEEIFKDS